MSLPGSQSAAPLSARSTHDGDAGQRPDAPESRRLRAVAAMRLADGRLDQSVGETEEAEREQQRRRRGGPGASGLEAPGQDQDLAREEREGRQAGEHAEGDAHRRSQHGLGAGDAGDGMSRGAGLVSEQRNGGVEAERLGDRVGDDVDGDTGESERCREADAERDDAHVLEARVGEQPLPGERPPEERDRDGERDETEADEDALCRPGPTTGASDCSERQATSSTAGRSAAERSAETGGGASACASGSQLCTGAQPILAARPASSRM